MTLKSLALVRAGVRIRVGVRVGGQLAITRGLEQQLRQHALCRLHLCQRASDHDAPLRRARDQSWVLTHEDARAGHLARVRVRIRVRVRVRVSGQGQG